MTERHGLSTTWFDVLNRFDLTDGRVSSIATDWDMASVARQLELTA